MQKILGYMRKAVQEFQLLSDGDRVAVGVSGGKDSVVLLTGLERLRSFIGIDFTVVGITLDSHFGGEPGDYRAIEALAAKRKIEYHIVPTEIGPIVFDHRKEDDAVETFVMNLFREGRIGCFSPMTKLDGKNLTVIRPLVLAPEADIRRAAAREGLPIVKNKCPADGTTTRQETKEWLAEMERKDRGFTYRLFGALRRSGIDGWGYPEKESSCRKKAAFSMESEVKNEDV